MCSTCADLTTESLMRLFHEIPFPFQKLACYQTLCLTTWVKTRQPSLGNPTNTPLKIKYVPFTIGFVCRNRKSNVL